MSGYIESGYIVALGALGIYGTTLLRREQLARKRLTQHDKRAESLPTDYGRDTEPEKVNIATSNETTANH